MKEIINTVPILLYIMVGLISMIMAVKSLFSDKYLPFHEKAANKPWNDIDIQLRPVILSLMRVAGLGFLIISVLLMIFPIVSYNIPDNFYRYSIPVLALLYCTGLFIINYLLYRNTKAETPWKGSLYAMIALIAGIIISALN